MGELLHDQGESLQALLHSARLRRREADDVSQRLLSDLNQRRSAQEEEQQRAMPPRPSNALARGARSAGLRPQARLPSHVLHSALDGEDGQRDCSICLDPLLVSLFLPVSLSLPPSLSALACALSWSVYIHRSVCTLCALSLCVLSMCFCASVTISLVCARTCK